MEVTHGGRGTVWLLVEMWEVHRWRLAPGPGGLKYTYTAS